MEMDHTLAPATGARDRRCAPVAVSEESPVGDVRVHGCSKGGGYRWHSGAGEALATRLKRVGDRVGPEGPLGSGHGRAQHGASQSATRNGRGECQAINAILAPMKSKRYWIRRGAQAASRRDLRAALAARLIGRIHCRRRSGTWHGD